MQTEVLGKRYERLLFFAAPITLAAAMVALASIGSATLEDRIRARCHAATVRLLEPLKDQLILLWKIASIKDGKKDIWMPSPSLEAYRNSLVEPLKGGGIDISCFGDKVGFFYAINQKNLKDNSPDLIISKFKSEGIELESRPLVMYGVELQSSTTYDLIGAKVKVQLSTLVQIAHGVLFPIFLIWLGSIYATRYRETFAIHRAASVVDVYPHVVNVYVVKPNSSRLRKESISYEKLKGACIFYGLLRLFYAGLIIAPPVVAYIYALVITYTDQSLIAGLMTMVCVITVIIFTLFAIFVEVAGWHLYKWFPAIDKSFD